MIIADMALGHMDEMIVADMALSHIDEIYEIETRCFAIPWSKNELRRELSNKHAIYKVALIEGPSNSPSGEALAKEALKVVGYAGLWHIVNEGQITNIAVDIPYRRRGIGSKLIEALTGCATELKMMGLTLEVRESDIGAQTLYKNHGFKPEGKRRRYYADNGEDAIIMWKYFEVN